MGQRQTFSTREDRRPKCRGCSLRPRTFGPLCKVCRPTIPTPGPQRPRPSPALTTWGRAS